MGYSTARAAVIKTAVRAAKLRYSVVAPKEDGSKAPALKWEKWQRLRPTARAVAAWYATHASTGVGLVAGRVSRNLEVLEFDDLPTYDAFVARAHARELGALVARFEHGYLEYSPRGVHWLYRCAVIGGNEKLAQRLKTPDEQRDPRDRVKTLVETRGEGGYIIIAPSHGRVHPEGGAYTVQHGTLVDVVTLTADERAQLFALAREFDSVPRRAAPPREQLHARLAQGNRVGDFFISETSWAEILEPQGWVWLYERGGVSYWCRPGKDSGVSASTNYHDSDLFYCWSTSTEFEAQRSYTKLGAWTLFNHAGDFLASAAALRAMGYGAAPSPQSTDPPRGGSARPDVAHDVQPDSGAADDEQAQRAGDGQDRPPGTPWPRYSAGGLVYEVSGLVVVARHATPTKWLLTVRRGPTPLATDKVDVASAAARTRWRQLVDAQVTPAERGALEALLAGLPLVIDQDEASWRKWQANQASLAAQRKAEADARQAEAEAEAARAEAAAQEAARAAALEATAATYLDRDSFLFDVKERIAEHGVVGEEANIPTLYLVFASQMLAESSNAVVKGESAGGKSHLVKSVLTVLPPSRYYDISSMSDKALIYDERPVAHRSLIIAEVHGQSEAAQYVMRTMISEGRIVHWVTEKLDGQFLAREIVREGPTNFVTTTTAPAVHDENETRLWTLTVDDSPATTEKVLALQALRAQGLLPAVDTQDWQDAFEWLVLAGVHDAVIPYADHLAAHMPSEPLRIRRDFARLLEAMRICAVLHQRQRSRDADGRVIATLADYAMVRALLADSFKIAVEGLTPKTVVLIAKVQQLHAAKAQLRLDADKGAVTVLELMQAFRKPKRTVHNWLKPALELGLLEDLNHGQKGKPLLLQPGTCTVAERSALPDVQVLADVCQETVAWVDPLTGERRNIFPTPPSSPGGTVAHPPESDTAVGETSVPDGLAHAGTLAPCDDTVAETDHAGEPVVPVCQSVPNGVAHSFDHTDTGQTGSVLPAAPDEERAPEKKSSVDALRVVRDL